MAVYGIYDLVNKEFLRHYELWYDEDAVAKLLALDEDVWMASGPEVEAIEDAAQEKAALRLFMYETKTEAEEDFESWNYITRSKCQIREIPEDEPEWGML